MLPKYSTPGPDFRSLHAAHLQHSIGGQVFRGLKRARPFGDPNREEPPTASGWSLRVNAISAILGTGTRQVPLPGTSCYQAFPGYAELTAREIPR
jgi:hypothetical protein